MGDEIDQARVQPYFADFIHVDNSDSLVVPENAVLIRGVGL